MSNNKNIHELLDNIEIDKNDISNLLQYIQHRQTAMLVIMFTDIKGFTALTERKGDEYAARLRSVHDDIMKSTIEENEAGKIIKYIGDAVMAVFAEPTAAVQKALAVQEAFANFNESNPDLEDIEIRIGLHMGQVAIENNLQADIFGRHVNRASRIEGLADGRQIYMSYPVFDSAKGWLAGKNNLGWKLHGEYFLKGIDKPAEVYEVFVKNTSVPKAPQKAKKKRIIPSWIFLIAALAIGFIAAFAFLQYEKTSLALHSFPYEDVYVDGSNRLFMDGEPGDQMRNVVTDIRPGRHVLHWDFSTVLRYYSEIELSNGENHLEPIFKEFRLPDHTLSRNMTEVQAYIETAQKQFTYQYYDSKNMIAEETLAMDMSIECQPVDDTVVKYIMSYEVELNGEALDSRSIEFEFDTNQSTTYRPDEEVYFIGEHFDFTYKVYASRRRAELELSSRWK